MKKVLFTASFFGIMILNSNCFSAESDETIKKICPLPDTVSEILKQSSDSKFSYMLDHLNWDVDNPNAATAVTSLYTEESYAALTSAGLKIYCEYLTSTKDQPVFLNLKVP